MFWEDPGLLVEGKRGLSIGTSEGCGTGAFEDLGPQALAWTIILGNQNHGDWWGPGRDWVFGSWNRYSASQSSHAKTLAQAQ